MRVSRLYVPMPLRAGETAELDGNAGHYLKSVLRARAGFKITLFNGDGFDYEGIIRVLSKDQTQVELCRQTKVETESFLKIHLGIGISKGDRMDYAIQKSVELGVQRITPLLTDHCVVRLDPPKAENRVQHWQRIAQSACEQSGRSRVPDIDPPTDLIDWISNPSGLKLFLDPGETRTLKSLPPPAPTGVSILSGPEGGFSSKERALFVQHDFLGVQLGPRILRSETAAMAILAAAQALWGDWG